MAAASSYTWATDATGRSGLCSTPAPLTVAGIADDELVGHRGAEDGAEQPVRLGDGRRAEAGVRQIGMPAPDGGRRDAPELDGT